MANQAAIITILTIIGVLIVPEVDGGIIGTIENGLSAFISGIDYVLTSFESVIKEILNPPRNRNSSIQYRLYTPESPQEPCYLEQNNEALERCPFNATYPLKFLIHGFLTEHPPLWYTKNIFLDFYAYNVILVDWTRYNQPPYTLAAVNSQLVGHELANLLQFLENQKGLDPTNVHLIGHSLGAHVSGVAGKETPNIGRITGLDPAFPLFSFLPLLHRLTYTDAIFVDVMHTSASTVGLGVGEPIGHQDFYPNGGSKQPQCVNGEDRINETESGNVEEGPLSLDVNVCDHSSAYYFFMESVNPAQCLFLSALCDNYDDFQAGKCSNETNLLARMGLHAQPILGLQPKSTFYLRTMPDPPYCLPDGYEPE